MAGAFTVIVLVGFSAYFTAAGPVCPDNVLANPKNSTLKVFGGSCLEFVPVREYWEDAKGDCESRSGRLVEIKSAEMQKFVYTTAKSLPFVSLGVWLGMDDRGTEGTWVYSSSGETMSGFSNWAIGQPACFLSGSLARLCIEDCGLMDMDEFGQWNDQYCHLAQIKYTYVCEYVLSGAAATATTTATTPAPTAAATTAAATTDLTAAPHATTAGDTPAPTRATTTAPTTTA